MINNKYGMFALSGLLSVLLLASPILAHVGDDNYSHHGMMDGSYGGMMDGYGMFFFGWIFMILIIIILVLVIIWLYKQIQEPRKRK